MDKGDPKVIEISEKLNQKLKKPERYQRIPPVLGVSRHLPFWNYLQWDAWGSGEIRGVMNPAKLLYERTVGKDVNPAMLLGRAIHACVLEPDTEWLRYYRLEDGKDRRSAEYKEAALEWGKDFVLRATEYDSCIGGRDQLHAHSRIGKLLKEGTPEVSFAWEDADTGLILKGRADWIAEKHRTVLDLKSTGNALEQWFVRIARDKGYPTQGIHYETGLRHYDVDVKYYTIVAVEVDPPYLPILYTISTKDMIIAEVHWRALVDRLGYCVNNDDWPGYPERTHVLHMGQWWEAGIQEEVAMLEEAIK